MRGMGVLRASAPDELANHPLTGPYAQRSLGPVVPLNDPAYALPSQEIRRSGAGVIHRDVPMVTTSTSWDVAGVRSALMALVQGLFDEPSQLVDAIASSADRLISSAFPIHPSSGRGHDTYPIPCTRTGARLVPR